MSKKKEKKNSRILFISDPHAPWMHPDSLAFLTALEKKYSFDRVVLLGDEAEAAAMSYHETSPDSFSAGDELLAAIEQLKPLYKLFPKVDVLESNHGSMVYRKAKTHGIPRRYIKGYNEILEAPKGWKWHDELIIDTTKGKVCVRHQFSTQPLVFAQQLAMSVVSGHFHSLFSIQYASSPDKLMFAMVCGCLIDKKSLTFAYNKLDLKRPIIGVGAIFDGIPKLLPMILNKKGRWTGEVP